VHPIPVRIPARERSERLLYNFWERDYRRCAAISLKEMISPRQCLGIIGSLIFCCFCQVLADPYFTRKRRVTATCLRLSPYRHHTVGLQVNSTSPTIRRRDRFYGPYFRKSTRRFHALLPIWVVLSGPQTLIPLTPHLNETDPQRTTARQMSVRQQAKREIRIKPPAAGLARTIILFCEKAVSSEELTSPEVGIVCLRSVWETAGRKIR
jgi:hypothetical protein